MRHATLCFLFRLRGKALRFRSIAASLTLKTSGRQKDALFVGQWAPTFLVLGVYNKLVKQLGSDRVENGL